MSTKATIIIFAVVFFLGLLLVVALPFLWNRGPALPRPPAELAGTGGGKTAGAQNQGVFRSDDGGKTWQQKSWVEGEEGSIASFKVNRLIPDPVDPAALYLLTDGHGLWVSRSRGDLWAPVIDQAKALDPAANILALAINPSNRREWYAAVFQKNRGRVLRSADEGGTWSEIYATPVERFGVFDVYYDRTRSSASIVTGQGGILETANQGRTWRVVRWFRNGLVRLLVNPINPSSRLAITREGNIFQTSDAGGTWFDVSSALNDFPRSTANQHWAADRNGVIYLGSKYGLLRSFDNGGKFEPLPLITPPEALPILAVAADPSAGSRLIVSASRQLYQSRDSGATWSILASPAGGKVTQLAIDRERPETIYAVVQP